MLGLARGGFGRDLVALFLVTVLVGGGIVGGLTRAVEGHFEGAVTRLIGTPGEYDILVHLRSDVGDDGINALADRFEHIAPGFRLKVGPTLAGRMNLFVGIPDSLRDADLFEQLHDEIGDLPGFDGYTFVIEPSVIVKDTHPLVRQRLMGDVQGMQGVRFAFEHSNSLWVVLEERSHTEAVRAQIEKMTGRMAVIDVRFPVPVDPGTFNQAETRIQEELGVAYPQTRFTALRAGQTQGGLLNDLVEVRRLLEQVASGSDASLAAKLDGVADALEQAAVNADRGVSASTLDTFYAALDQMNVLEERLNSIAEQLKSADAESQTTDVLIAMLLQRLVGSLAGESASDTPPTESVDVEELRAGLDRLAEQFALLNELDFGELATSLRNVEAFVGGLDAGALQRAMEGMDRLIRAQGADGRSVEILAEGPGGLGDVQSAVRAAVAPVLEGPDGAEGVDVFVRSAGVVEADARTALMLVIDNAVDLVALLAALLCTALFFLLDTSTLLSFVKAQRSLAGERVRSLRRRIGVAGGAWFALVLTTVAWVGGGVPVLYLTALAVGGFCVGFVVAFAAERVSPVDLDQLEAAASLGMPTAAILRRVVVPGGRPGLLLWLNRLARPPIRGERNAAGV